jgi:hypothetical protein
MSTNHPDHPPIPGGYTGLPNHKLQWYADTDDGSMWFTRENETGLIGCVRRLSHHWDHVVQAGIRHDDAQMHKFDHLFLWDEEFESFEEAAKEIADWFKYEGYGYLSIKGFKDE